MGCDICGRPQHSQKLPFLCAVDARNELYEARIAHAVALIQNEKLEQQVNTELGYPPNAGTDTDTTSDTNTAAPRIRLETLETERQESLQRTNDATARSRKIRRELEATRKELERQRELLKQRRSDLAAAANGTAARRQRMQADVERSISMIKFKWNQSYESMTTTRGFLCLEASRLYGLRRIDDRRSGEPGASTTRYEIGGFEIVDPYNMNNIPPEVISTSLAHITHILVLACHYLSIRLPAEITLPHRDYPRPTIFTLQSSYSHGEVPFPGTGNLHPDAAAPTAVAHLSSGPQPGGDFQHVPRARPLYIDKPLGTLAKEDGPVYASFLEGVSLLAYNVAWACCSQGVPITASEGKASAASFDEVFSIGRNLFNLLISSQNNTGAGGRIFSPTATPAMSPSPSRNGAASPISPGAGATNKTNVNGPTPPLSMGRYSHGTTHTFLGDDVMRSFKLPGANRLSDRLKTKLSSETTMPDWEVLEDDAWAVEDEDQQHMADGVLRRTVAPPVNQGLPLPGSNGGRHPGVAGRNGGIIVGSMVPEKRLYGVESVATVMDESVANLPYRENVPVPVSARMAQRLTPNRGGGPGAGTTGTSSPSPGTPEKDRRPKNNGTSGWTKLRNR